MASYASRNLDTDKNLNSHVPRAKRTKKTAEDKVRESRTLNSYLYAAPDVIERLTQGATKTKVEYRAEAIGAIETLDDAFCETKRLRL